MRRSLFIAPSTPGPFPPRRASVASAGLAERGLGLLHQGVEGGRLAGGEISHHLAVHGDAGLLDAGDELRVGEAMGAGAGVDALDPEGAEIALLVAAVAIGVLQRLLDALERDAVVGGGAAVVAGSHVDGLLVTGVRGDAALDASHGADPPLEAVGQIGLL